MLGFIALNKPSGLTSHDCVARVRRLLKLKKVGHGGTLDPLATGVLPIAVGRATRLLQFLPENKAYHAKIRLGMQTTTDDLEGEVIKTQPAPNLSLEDIQPLLKQFIGSIQQIPPAYSAIQKDGKRLYELARKGEIVEVPVRTVEVTKIDILGWYPGEFPELDLDIYCGPGTYIRAIARDIGTKLNIGGTLAGLKRTESCGMILSETITLEELKIQIEQETFSLIKPELVLQHLPIITLSLEEGKRWCQGQKIPINLELLSSIIRVNDETGEFLGIGNLREEDDYQLLIPQVVIKLY
ncbi:tRNA pseudouridine(55) synthase TruB [Crocosphaera sp. XPORK-15E]|uniref:tRNA pseudouridine(55) synthase TruB n=1 Tax=Crocosphaera sp. XPORK-15E TaxID=3110247 RepID=UPI002B219A46|nr:tRNA pseudouridine(55) synthase TruB [Crocosphaera sp. XPORK-15E]MEA5537298.1 tRNA pseudouridine(55) synthase TruB [Crocosphaera sp. XPORK-15E]